MTTAPRDATMWVIPASLGMACRHIETQESQILRLSCYYMSSVTKSGFTLLWIVPFVEGWMLSNC